MGDNDTPEHDVLIVGAGAAGLTAAIMLARARWRVLVISKPGRRNTPAASVHNIPYADGLAPAELYRKMESDARRYGVALLEDEVLSASTTEDSVTVSTVGNGVLRGRRLLLATGRVNRLPSWLPDGLWGKTVFDCPYCHGPERAGGDFLAIGTGFAALKLTALARTYAATIGVLVSDESALDEPLAKMLISDGIPVHHAEVKSVEVQPSGRMTVLTTQEVELEADTLLLAEVPGPYDALANSLELDLTDDGYVETTMFGVTSDPLVFSAGNVEGSPYFMWTGAASSGLNTGRLICEDLAFGERLLSGR